ncbi:MAG: hypothetical protein L6455_15080 [Kiritimatiellae bacterium]|nr:hypothetical protein [Kiritimatiellia bacterium]
MRKSIVYLLMVILGSISLAAEKAATDSKESIEVNARKAGGRKTAVKGRILAEVRPLADKTFDYATSASNKLHGFVTYSIPQAKDSERPYVAYIYLNWGDLDDLIPHCSSNFYQNWDGQVKIQQAGYCSVVQEFAFDNAGNREPKVGSGVDKLLKDETSSQVRWLSGIVGATDGLLVKIAMQKPEARGEIKAGTFTIPFEIRPKTEAEGQKDKNPALKGIQH